MACRTAATVGLAQAPDGSVYVSDDKAGWIWPIFYVGKDRD